MSSGKKGRPRKFQSETEKRAWWSDWKKQQYATNPEYRKKIRAKQKLYYQQHKEIIKENVKKWIKANPDRARATMTKCVREWRKANPKRDKVTTARYQQSVKGKIAKRKVDHIRRARMKQVECEKVEIILVLQQSNKQCGICKRALDYEQEPYHIDHIIPLAKGGGHVMTNLQLAHPKCNMQKGSH